MAFVDSQFVRMTIGAENTTVCDAEPVRFDNAPQVVVFRCDISLDDHQQALTATVEDHEGNPTVLANSFIAPR